MDHNIHIQKAKEAMASLSSSDQAITIAEVAKGWTDDEKKKALEGIV